VPARACRCEIAGKELEDALEFFETVESRHSIRSFSSEPVSRETVDRLLSAAATAPSSFNEQPWHFYVAQGEAREKVGQIMAQSTSYLEEFIEVLGPDKYEFALQWYADLGGAPVLLACTTLEGGTEFQHLNRLIAVGAAIENLLLSATALGLGACNISFAYMVKDDIEEALGIPEGRSLVSIIALGHPSAEQAPAPPRNPDVADYLG
jgi:nitroreductase